jgi:hypothetical protein
MACTARPHLQLRQNTQRAARVRSTDTAEPSGCACGPLSLGQCRQYDIPFARSPSSRNRSRAVLHSRRPSAIPSIVADHSSQ